jgi:hypothetical protein
VPVSNVHVNVILNDVIDPRATSQDVLNASIEKGKKNIVDEFQRLFKNNL